jgi:hypothetical protein
VIDVTVLLFEVTSNKNGYLRFGDILQVH